MFWKHKCIYTDSCYARVTTSICKTDLDSYYKSEMSSFGKKNLKFIHMHLSKTVPLERDIYMKPQIFHCGITMPGLDIVKVDKHKCTWNEKLCISSSKQLIITSKREVYLVNWRIVR